MVHRSGSNNTTAESAATEKHDQQSIRNVITLGLLIHLAVIVLAWMIGEQFPIANPDNEGLWTAGPEALQNLARWDSGHYLRIAEDGYSDVLWVFSPGYPLLMRAVSTLTSFDLVTSGVLISIGSGILFLVAFYRITLILFPDARFAWRATVFASIAPGAVFMTAAYADAMFMALSTWGLLYLLRKNWIPAGVLIGFAAITRPFGFVLIGVYGLYLLRTIFIRQHSWRAILGLVPALIPTAIYLIYGAHHTGTFFFHHTVRESYFPANYVKWPFSAIAFQGTLEPHTLLIFLSTLFVLLSGIYSLWMIFKERSSISLPIYLYSIFLACSYTMYADVFAMTRYALSVLPGFWMLSKISERSQLFWVLVGLSIILAFFSLSLFVNWWRLY